MIETRRTEPHWNYLLALEGDLHVLSRYVDFHEANFGCFSVEIVRVLLAAAAEADVVCKALCRSRDASSKADGIHDYRREILTVFPAFAGYQVLVPRFGLTLNPWSNFAQADGVPDWWTAYNKVKHHRAESYEHGNLANALHAVAGLFVGILYLYRDAARLGQLVPSPELFRVADVNFGGTGFLGHEKSILYLFPDH